MNGEGVSSGSAPEGATPFEVPKGATSIEISKEFAAFKVVPKEDGEGRDPNFPPHLHAAIELFCHAKMPENARRCAIAVNSYLNILREGPDGKNTNGMGQAAVCWQCGHVGLPKNPENCSKGEFAECGGCESDDQTNMVKVIQVSANNLCAFIHVSCLCRAEHL